MSNIDKNGNNGDIRDGARVWLKRTLVEADVGAETTFPMTNYCREEFAKFRKFLTSKKCQNWTVFG